MENVEKGFLQEEGKAQQTGGVWLNVTRGKLVRKVEEGTEGAISRMNKLGNKVWEKFYSKIVFKIESMNIVEGEYGKQIFLNTTIGGVKHTISINNSTSYARSFYQQIFNVNLNKYFTFQPYSFEDENGKKRTGVTLYQDGQKIEKKFPENTPEVEFKQKDGKYIVNQIQEDDRLEFLENNLIKLAKENNLNIVEDEVVTETEGTVKPSQSKSKKEDSDFDFDDF